MNVWSFSKDDSVVCEFRFDAGSVVLEDTVVKHNLLKCRLRIICQSSLVVFVARAFHTSIFPMIISAVLIGHFNLRQSSSGKIKLYTTKIGMILRPERYSEKRRQQRLQMRCEGRSDTSTYLENAIVKSEISEGQHEHGHILRTLEGEASEDSIRLFFKVEVWSI
jgi:hypothetical protein